MADDSSGVVNTQLSLEETYADVAPVRSGSEVSSYVSIMRGCNNMCTFCIVPFTRGRERSRPLPSVVQEVGQLSKSGVRLVTLLGQNVNSYYDTSHPLQTSTSETTPLPNPRHLSEMQAHTTGQQQQQQHGHPHQSSLDNHPTQEASQAHLKIQQQLPLDLQQEQQQQELQQSAKQSEQQQQHQCNVDLSSAQQPCQQQQHQYNKVEPLQVKSEGAQGRDGDPSGVYAPGFKSVYKPKRTGGHDFADLLGKVARENPETLIHFTSPHPKDFPLSLLETIARYPNISRQLHMPAQSGSTSVLARMQRGYSREAYDDLIATARDTLPDLALSTDIIVGFCGESASEHRDTVDLMARTRYDQAYMFAYSQREGTRAARRLVDDVTEDVKLSRLQEVISEFRKGAAEALRKWVGQQVLVLVEGRSKKDGRIEQGVMEVGERVKQQSTPNLSLEGVGVPSSSYYPRYDTSQETQEYAGVLNVDGLNSVFGGQLSGESGVRGLKVEGDQVSLIGGVGFNGTLDGSRKRCMSSSIVKHGDCEDNQGQLGNVARVGRWVGRSRSMHRVIMDLKLKSEFEGDAIHPGDFVVVRITGSNSQCLYGDVEGQSSTTHFFGKSATK